MKNKSTLYLMMCLILFSCNKNWRKNKDDSQITIEDPNEFKGGFKSKVSVLGVFHFDNPGLDTYKEQFKFNILSKKRQAENEELLRHLADFKPTKILIENNRIQYDSILNKEYSNYLTGNFDIVNKKSETYQIGFKLAELLGHKRLYCSDAKAEWFGVELDWDNYDDIAYVKSKGQYEKYVRYNYEKIHRKSDSLKAVLSITDFFNYINEPNNTLKDHQGYLTSIVEGAGDNYLGADNVARWYRRNLRIFSNIYDITDFNKEERLLVIYGVGHVYQLKQLLTDSPDFEYIEINKYLKE